MNYTAVTLARSGSKAIPNKNILTINDISISHYPIKAANESKFISTLVYSSDSPEYLKLAQNFFEKNSFDNLNLELHLRSKKNSDDSASSWDAIKEVFETLKLKTHENSITLLAATCPTLTGKDINKFFKQINPYQSAMSVREVDYPLENTFSENDRFFKKHCLTNFLDARQKKKKYFRPDGHIYFRPKGDLGKVFPHSETQLVNLQKYFYANIDTLIDLNFAKYTMENIS